jgi:hypothetical protein
MPLSQEKSFINLASVPCVFPRDRFEFQEVFVVLFNFSLISSLGSQYITQEPLIRINPCGLQTFAVSAQWIILLTWIMLAFSARRIRVT